MTTILAVQGNGWASIGYDSAITEVHKKSLVKNSKYFQRDDFHVVFAGELRVGQIVANELFLPSAEDITTYEEFDKYIYNFFIGSLLKTYKENKIKRTEEKEWPIELLVMWNGIVCEISSDLSFAREDRGIHALGSGQSYGIGALAAIYKDGTQKSANSAIKQAISIASEYDTYTGLPAHVVSTKLKSEWKDK